MSRLLAKLGMGLAYFSIATVLAEGTLLAIGWSSGTLNEDRLLQIQAILQGQDLVALELKRRGEPGKTSTEQPSYEEVVQARAAKLRQLELREEMLRQAVSQFDVDRAQFTAMRQEFDQIKKSFDDQLAALREAVLGAGEENVRLIYENIKPLQAKEQLLEMIQRGEVETVVALLAAMPVGKKAKIVAEFKSPEEAAKLSELLRLMLEGQPDTRVIDTAQTAAAGLNDKSPKEAQK